MLKQFLLNNWEDLVDDKKPRLLDLATISSCNEEYGNDLVLLFVDNGTTPQCILKVVRDPKYNFKLERENFALTTLSDSGSLKNFLPVSCSSGDINGRYFFIQEVIAGQNLNNLLLTTGLTDNSLELLKQSILLLCTVNMSHSQVSAMNKNAEISDLNTLLLPEQKYHSVGISDDDLANIVSAHDYFKNLGRMFFLHGDYWPANILVDEKRGKVNGVIDWEFSSPFSAVPTDIIWFLINVSYTLFGHDHSRSTLKDAFKWGFFTPGEHNKVFINFFQLYMTKLDLSDRGLFKPLLVLSLCGMAMREKITYGRHCSMDNDCLDLLSYALKHDSYMDSL